MDKIVKTVSYRYVKRLWEVGFILILVPFLLLLMLLIAFAIKFNSRGPVLFTQNRVGKEGKTFKLYKFRSMHTNIREKDAQFTKPDDVRITSFGRIMRKMHLDELPQFWNVLKGDMSLVGPRPEQQYFVKLFNKKISCYSNRHKVRPGMTGLAQIKSGYASSLSSTQKKLKYDLWYIKNMSFFLDLSIIFNTIKIVIAGFITK